MSLQVGDVVVRDDGARYRLRGTLGRSWSAERLDAFEGVVKLTPRALASYTLENGEQVTPDAARTPLPTPEAEGRAAMHERAVVDALAAEPGRTALVKAHAATMAAAQAQLDDFHAVIPDES